MWALAAFEAVPVVRNPLWDQNHWTALRCSVWTSSACSRQRSGDAHVTASEVATKPTTNVESDQCEDTDCHIFHRPHERLSCATR